MHIVWWKLIMIIITLGIVLWIMEGFLRFIRICWRITRGIYRFFKARILFALSLGKDKSKHGETP